jgi:hypothetical protein
MLSGAAHQSRCEAVAAMRCCELLMSSKERLIRPSKSTADFIISRTCHLEGSQMEALRQILETEGQSPFRFPRNCRFGSERAGP